MKKIAKFLFTSLLAFTFLLQGTLAFAETETDYRALAEDMAKNYDATEEFQAEQASNDTRFVNEMVLEQEKKQSEMKKRFDIAKKNGEKFYTAKQILQADADDFNISEEDMEKIKGLVLAQKTDLENLINGFEKINKGDHEIVKNIKKELNRKIPASEIYIDHSVDSQDGKISGGGWPYCLDDNGYGYRNFITSDCYKAIVGFVICAADSTVGKMNSSLRYCKAYKKNCSPLIGHSKYNHKHKWYQKIP